MRALRAEVSAQNRRDTQSVRDVILKFPSGEGCPIGRGGHYALIAIYETTPSRENSVPPLHRGESKTVKEVI